jgi:hypothetical protein
MKFLSVYKTAERSVPPSQEEMARMGKLIEEGMKEPAIFSPWRVAYPAPSARVCVSRTAK